MDYNSNIAALRRRMKECGVDMCMITTEDAYLADCAGVVDYWMTLKWLTGFTGSFGYGIVTQDEVTFWTDARYRVRAKGEIKVDNTQHFDITSCGADYYLEWITEKLSSMNKEHPVFAVDGRTMTAKRGLRIAESVKKADSIFRTDLDLVGDIWADRPAPAYTDIFELELKYCGRSRKDKIDDVHEKLKKFGANYTIADSMEDVAWLTNLRGLDVNAPLFMSHAVVTPTGVWLFARLSKIPEELKKKLISDNYELYEIEDAPKIIGKIPSDAVVYYDPRLVNYSLSSSIPENVKTVTGDDIINYLKGIKNKTEIENFVRANIYESVALFRLSEYIKHNCDGKANEYDCEQILEDLRRKNPQEYIVREGFKPPIMAPYMANAALPHYLATKENYATYKPSGAVLVDTGAYYLCGTIDFARTYYLGPCDCMDELKHDYTLTLLSLLSVERQVFRKGADGACLDAIARHVMWNERLQYSYATGHGLGYCSCGHEGPFIIGEPSYKKETSSCDVVMEKGMVVSCEPGVYKEGKYGIRIEDNMYIEEDTTNEFGEFYHFVPMTYAPYERELIDLSMLTDEQIDYLNKFHQESYRRLSPYLTEDEKKVLAERTAPLKR